MSTRIVVPCLALAALQLACGEDPPPVCPNGDCNLPGSTIVKWRFNHYPQWQFESDACSELGVARVRVEIVNAADPTVTEMEEKLCGEGQLTFLGLPGGTYTVALTPLDINGEELVAAAVAAQGLAGATNSTSEIVVDVPHTAWTRAYTGQFLFRLSWGGMSCELATPPVAKQVLTLTAGGQVVTAVTDTNQKLDGTEAGPCRLLTEQYPQFSPNIAFGPATLHVVGTGQNMNDVLFDQQFDTFIGAGTFNPTLTFDVAPVPPPDAGVDAPPDTL